MRAPPRSYHAPARCGGLGAGPYSLWGTITFFDTWLSRSATRFSGFRGSKNAQNVLFCSARAFWAASFTCFCMLFAFFTTPNRPNLHTLQCARVLGRPNCIPCSARAPSDSPGLGAVHFGGPSEAKFAYLTVRARPWEAKFAHLTVRVPLRL